MRPVKVMGMKKTAWLTRKVLVRGIAALATGGAAIALVYGVQSGTVKAGFGADETVTKSEKRDNQGNITETTTTKTFQDAKTLWDWLSLLGVPFSLAILGYVLQQFQQARAEQQAKAEKELADQRVKIEKEIAESHQREEALQNYLDRLSELLIDKNLIAIATKLQDIQDRTDGPQDLIRAAQVVFAEFQTATPEEVELVNAAKDVIQARTLSILRRLGQDGERKGDVIQFLLEAEVIRKLKLVLSRADLSRARLSSVNISNVNLNRANLSGAYLSGANISGTNLSGTKLIDAEIIAANLSGANLSGADLSHAKLHGAYLEKANLNSANLSFANLSFAKKWTEAQLAEAQLCRTMLPEGCNLNPNRDCEALGISLDLPAIDSPK